MKFPVNVFEMEERAGKSDASTKRGALWILGIVVNGMMYYYGSTLCILWGMPVFLLIIAILLIDIVVGLAIFRHFVLHEEEQQKEYEASKSESLSNYYYLRKEEDLEVNLDDDNSVHIYQYENNSFMFALRFRYGSNSKLKCINTKNAFEDIFNILGKNKLEFRVYNMPDDFEDTHEYKDFVRRLSNIENDKLSKTMLQIAEGMLNYADKYSSVQCTVLLVRTITASQFYRLSGIIMQICSKVFEEQTAFSSIQFLHGDKFRAFLRDYYGLEALDLSMIKSIEPDKSLIRYYKKYISLYQVRTEEGNIYTDDSVLEPYTSTGVKAINYKK